MLDESTKKYLRNILFIDIETVSTVSDYDLLDGKIKKLWDKKASYLKNDEGLPNDEFYFKRAGIYAEFGKIICIGFGGVYFNEENEMCFRTKSISGHDEAEILFEFKNLLERHKSGKNLMLCAHNGKEFDFPYLCRRMLVNRIDLPQTLKISGRKPWEVPHLDTLDLWKFGDYKHYTSLDLLTTIFGIPSSKTEMNGEDVNTVYHKERNLEKIARYCQEDVVVLSQLFLQMNNLEAIDENNVFRIA
jgi:3'-5' exonuclease